MIFKDKTNTHIPSYADLCTKFGFLSKLTTIEPIDLKNNYDRLVKYYSGDIQTSLGDEMVQFASLRWKDFATKLKIDWLIMYWLCVDYVLSDHVIDHVSNVISTKFKRCIVNVEIAFRVYLCLMVSNCAGERSFSKLKRIKDETWSTIRQERVNMLSPMSIENDILSEMSFHDLVILDFASEKARKAVIFW